MDPFLYTLGFQSVYFTSWIDSEKIQENSCKGKETNSFRGTKQKVGFRSSGHAFIFCVPKGDGGHIRSAFGIKEKLLSVDVQHMGQESHHSACVKLCSTHSDQAIHQQLATPTQDRS